MDCMVKCVCPEGEKHLAHPHFSELQLEYEEDIATQIFGLEVCGIEGWSRNLEV